MKSNAAVSNLLNTKGAKADKSNAYQDGFDYELRSSVKAEQREKILSIILNSLQENTPVRYLGMPGKHWLFENMLVNAIDRESDTPWKIGGIEKSVKIYHQSRAMMPGFCHWCVDKSNFANECGIEQIRKGRVFYACGDLTSLTDDKIIKDVSEKSGTFEKNFTKNTIVWYDFTASLSMQTYLSIYQIKNVIDRDNDAIVCITLMYGRDLYMDGKGENGRISIIKKALPEFELIESWIYKGFKNAPMINICGRIPKKV